MLPPPFFWTKQKKLQLFFVGNWSEALLGKKTHFFISTYSHQCQKLTDLSNLFDKGYTVKNLKLIRQKKTVF